MNKMFETATKNKYRFPFKGLITTEDLWDLSLENLDVVFRALNKEKKTTDESSLLRSESKEDKILSEKIEIVQYIFMEKQKEKEDQINARKIRLEKQKLYALLQEKKDEELRGKSVEELKKNDRRIRIKKKAPHNEGFFLKRDFMKIDLYNTENKYDLILADPPWRQFRGGKKKVRKNSSGIELPYNTLSLYEIQEHLKQATSLCQENSILFLWTITSTCLKHKK